MSEISRLIQAVQTVFNLSRQARHDPDANSKALENLVFLCQSPALLAELREADELRRMVERMPKWWSLARMHNGWHVYGPYQDTGWHATAHAALKAAYEAAGIDWRAE